MTICGAYDRIDAARKGRALPYTVGGQHFPRREVVSMVTYGELFAYTMVLLGVATLVLQLRNKK